MDTCHGRKTAYNKLIRSSHLGQITDDEAVKIAALADTIVDLRTDTECAENPDRPVPGSRHVQIPVFTSLKAGITREKESDKKLIEELILKPAEAKDYMKNMYRSFVEEEPSQNFAKFIGVLLEHHDKAVLWHCTAGKDRAGIAAVITLELLGVSRQDIISDYMETNRSMEKDIRRYLKYFAKRFGTDEDSMKEAVGHMFMAEKDYLDIYYETVEEKYKSFDGYIQNGLKITEKQREDMLSYLD